MAKRNKSGAVLVPTDLGFHALVFDEHDVARLLRAAVEREGGQSAFAKHHGVDRASIFNRDCEASAEAGLMEEARPSRG